MDRLDNFDIKPFISGPSEFLVATLAKEFRKVKQFAMIFGEFIDPYMRTDYPDRNLPVMRIYNERYVKDSESWFEAGDIMIDVIFPPSLRREELQSFQDTISSAIVQQLRRTPFFNAVSDCVPGLNELGKVLSVDKTLGFEWKDELIVPLTQMTANFRVDLRIWDDYLESTNRTKDDPFEYTLQNLERIYTTIQGLDDEKNVKATVKSQQNI